MSSLINFIRNWCTVHVCKTRVNSSRESESSGKTGRRKRGRGLGLDPLLELISSFLLLWVCHLCSFVLSCYFDLLCSHHIFLSLLKFSSLSSSLLCFLSFSYLLSIVHFLLFCPSDFPVFPHENLFLGFVPDVWHRVQAPG